MSLEMSSVVRYGDPYADQGDNRKLRGRQSRRGLSEPRFPWRGVCPGAGAGGGARRGLRPLCCPWPAATRPSLGTPASFVSCRSRLGRPFRSPSHRRPSPSIARAFAPSSPVGPSGTCLPQKGPRLPCSRLGPGSRRGADLTILTAAGPRPPHCRRAQPAIRPGRHEQGAPAGPIRGTVAALRAGPGRTRSRAKACAGAVGAAGVYGGEVGAARGPRTARGRGAAGRGRAARGRAAASAPCPAPLATPARRWRLEPPSPLPSPHSLPASPSRPPLVLPPREASLPRAPARPGDPLGAACLGPAALAFQAGTLAVGPERVAFRGLTASALGLCRGGRLCRRSWPSRAGAERWAWVSSGGAALAWRLCLVCFCAGCGPAVDVCASKKSFKSLPFPFAAVPVCVFFVLFDKGVSRLVQELVKAFSFKQLRACSSAFGGTLRERGPQRRRLSAPEAGA